MASLEELEQEQTPPVKSPEAQLELMKKDFLVQYAYPYNRQRVSEALDKLLEHVKTHR